MTNKTVDLSRLLQRLRREILASYTQTWVSNGGTVFRKTKKQMTEESLRARLIAEILVEDLGHRPQGVNHFFDLQRQIIDELVEEGLLVKPNPNAVWVRREDITRLAQEPNLPVRGYH